MNATFNNYYKVGGALERNAPSYGVRQADENFYKALKAGEFCYVLNSRQMGKSSLRVRTVGRLEADGIACSQIDITSIGSRGITASEWYWGVVRRLDRAFKTSIDLKTWWHDRAEASPVDRLSQFIEEVLLVEVQTAIVIFIDEIDSILNLDFKDDFFALIRTCYNQRAENPAYRRLTFALLGVATPSDLIQDKSRTPFNIGRSIELRGLQLDEAKPLAVGLEEKAEDAIAVLRSVLDWTGGQPFLTQKVCQFLQSSDWIPAGHEAERVEAIVHSRVIANWEGQDEPEHLRTIQNRLVRDDDRKGQLLGLYQQILQQGAIAATASEEQFQLRLSGLVVQYQGRLQPHNRIYATVFNQNWAETILEQIRPYAEPISIWLKSDRQDESRLLRGSALEEAQRWATDKHLSEQDVRFLSASEQAEKQVMAEENRILSSAKRKAMLLLGMAVTIAVGSGLWATNATMNAKRAEEEQRSAETKTQEANERANLVQDREQKANRNLDNVRVRLVSATDQAKSAKEQERQAKANLQTAKQEQQEAESELKEASQQLQTANQRVATARQELTAVREQFDSANEAVAAAEEKVKDAQAQQRDAEKRVAEATAKLKPIEKELKHRQAEVDDVWEFVRGASAAISGKPDEAMKIFDRILERNSQNSFVRISRANIYIDQKKYTEAEAELKKVIEFDPKNAAAHYNLGVALYRQNKLDEAVLAYRKAIELDPKNGQAFYNNLGATLDEQNKLDEAIVAYRKAIELDPKNGKAYNNLGITLNKQNKLDEAVSAHRKAIELEPKDAEVYNNLGITLDEQNNLDGAVAAYQKAIELKPEDAKAYNNLGFTLNKQNKLDEAVAAYRKAIELDSKNAVVYNNLGITLDKQGNLDEAVVAYRKAVEFKPEYAEAYTNLGIVLRKQNKLDAAISAFQKAIKLNAKLVLPIANLGYIYHLQGRKAESLEQLNRAIALDPDFRWAIALRDKIQKSK